MIAIVDYGMGNLHSVKNALSHLGLDAIITADKDELRAADRIILPGVGAFPDAMRALKASVLDTLLVALAKEKKPLLGICLGMQLLFDKSFEFEETEGLGLIEGEVRPLDAKGLKIPHMGWNSLKLHQKSDPLVSALADGDHVYFVHSFAAVTDSANIVASSEYGSMVPALVKNPTLPVWGAQFHPEKSHEKGLSILRAFCEVTV